MAIPVATRMSGWIDVDSECHSAVRVVPRGPSACDFDVIFRKSGRSYRYSRLPYDLVGDYFLAPSKGAFFNANIRDSFSVRQL